VVAKSNLVFVLSVLSSAFERQSDATVALVAHMLNASEPSTAGKWKDSDFVCICVWQS